MLGIYKKKVADDEFLFIPKEPCPFVNAQGIVRCRSEAFFPDMSPVVVEGHMGDEGIYHIEKIAYPLSNKREASFFLNYLETKLPDSEKIQEKSDCLFSRKMQKKYYLKRYRRFRSIFYLNWS